MKEHIIRDCLPIDEFPSYMDGWSKKKPGFVTVSSIGKSGGYDILKAVFTDPSVPDEDKQVVLLTAQHSMELSGVNTLLGVGNFLVSDRDDAAEILKKEIVVMIPCSNPYSYSKQDPAYQFRNEAGICEYFAFRFDHIAYDEATAPAAYAVKRVIDEYTPDLMLDVHGVWYQDQMVIPSFGTGGNGPNHSYNKSFVDSVLRAGTEAGSAVFDNDSYEMLFMTDRKCQNADITNHFFATASDQGAGPMYPYYNYHTLFGAFETCWEEQCVTQIIEALRIGCGVWGSEYYSGYPTRTVVSPMGHNSIRAYGITAADRRKSRVELWRIRNKIRLGVGHPEMPGLSAAIICLDPESGKVAKNYEPMESSVKKMAERYEGVNADKILELTSDFYPLYMAYPDRGNNLDGETPLEIKHGMTVRMSLPFADACNYTVLYNGNELGIDELDGYTVTKANNWVHVDIHIPAHKICPFAIAMVKYDCTVPKVGIMEF